MPKPNSNESKEAFINRFMASTEANKDYPESAQRYAVAESEWKSHLSKGIPIAKSNDEEQLVFGWASVAKNAQGVEPLDWQGDIIDPTDLERAVYKFNLEFRESNDMHVPNTVNGMLVESVMFTKDKMEAMGIPEGIVPEGWWVGFKISDPVAYAKVKNGIYKMFSIEGSGTRTSI